MNRLYSQRTKDEAVRRVVVERQPVSQVAREMRIGEGSVFFWVRRHRQTAPRNAAGPLLRETILRLERRVLTLQSQLQTVSTAD